MALILNIESATTSCSVALSQDSRLLALKEINEGYSHAENLHCFIENVFAQAGKKLNELSAVAVSKGPGSYTGLRIGVSAAKGLAYALGIPLIAVDTLQAMSYFAASGVEENATLFPMLDARRMEVYTAAYSKQCEPLRPVSAVIFGDQVPDYFKTSGPAYFFGDGMPKCREILSQLPQSAFIDNVFPSAAHMPFFSFRKYLKEQFEDLAYFEPFYLKDFHIHTRKKPS